MKHLRRGGFIATSHQGTTTMHYLPPWSYHVRSSLPRHERGWNRSSPAKALKVMGASSDGFVFPRFCTVWSTSSAAVPPMCRKKPLQVNVTHLTHFDTLIISCIMHLLVNTQVSQTLLMRSLAMLVNLSFKTAPCSTVIWKNELWTSAPNTRCLFLIFIFIISMFATPKPAPGLPDLWWDSPWLPLQLGSNSCLENTETKFPVSMTKKIHNAKLWGQTLCWPHLENTAQRTHSSHGGSSQGWWQWQILNFHMPCIFLPFLAWSIDVHCSCFER